MASSWHIMRSHSECKASHRLLQSPRRMSPAYGYGNGATVDYFADTFRYNVLNQQGVVPPIAGAWVNSLITVEADLLP
jgi:hypothetical protein